MMNQMMKITFFPPKVFFFISFSLSSDSEIEDKLHLRFLYFLVLLFCLFLCGEDFASFAFTATSAGSLCEPPALSLFSLPA